MALAFPERGPRLGIESGDAFLLEVGSRFSQIFGRRYQAYPALVAADGQLRHVLAGNRAGDFVRCSGRDRGVHVHLQPASNAAFARRTRLGCRTPSLGVWPCGAPGGTRNHCSLYGNSFTLRRSNLVGTLSPESVYASPSAGRIRNSPEYSLSMFCEVP